MQLLAHLPLLSLLATAANGLQLLQYDIPDELLALFGAGNPDPVASASAAAPTGTGSAFSSSSHSSAPSSSSSSSSCYYPATFTLDNLTTWSPAANTSQSYVSFLYIDSGTKITTPCSYNASSQSLTVGTSLTPRYACDDSTVSFIWQKGKITAIEATCPGQTATKFEASGSLVPRGLQCSKTNSTDDTGLSQGAGTICVASGSLSGNFTSQEPSPLQN
ncbi:hypothetical protein SPBR_07788 [Sporothrix brasiliensis 5110]|uniref:Ig-like domain-containing protein n=1 Tax=Sporothrix brasiliensis 5110 TaxID=1398154 RepID=A0A0C2INC8_9PEZI|nr:uncharacterized protein SPBR_07788 [Sporothrix brasiliensis 5110]KIH88490.1 hypothetical protein SPBR_07788 [Sporothrix brasiliensis 5110]